MRAAQPRACRSSYHCDVLAGDNADVLAADNADVLAADTTDVLAADNKEAPVSGKDDDLSDVWKTTGNYK